MKQKSQVTFNGVKLSHGVYGSSKQQILFSSNLLLGSDRQEQCFEVKHFKKITVKALKTFFNYNNSNTDD